MILTGSEIYDKYKTGDIVITPFTHENISVNSYDVTLSSKIVTYVPIDISYDNSITRQYIPFYNIVLDTKYKNDTYEYTIPDTGIILIPGILYLMQTNEAIGSTKYQPCYDGRSSMARLGIQSHISAGFGDIGYTGKWTLEVTVVHPVKLYKDMRIGQVYFNTVDGKIDKLYNGKYGKDNVIASEGYKDYDV